MIEKRQNQILKQKKNLPQLTNQEESYKKDFNTENCDSKTKKQQIQLKFSKIRFRSKTGATQEQIVSQQEYFKQILDIPQNREILCVPKLQQKKLKSLSQHINQDINNKNNINSKSQQNQNLKISHNPLNQCKTPQKMNNSANFNNIKYQKQETNNQQQQQQPILLMQKTSYKVREQQIKNRQKSLQFTQKQPQNINQNIQDREGLLNDCIVQYQEKFGYKSIATNKQQQQSLQINNKSDILNKNIDIEIQKSKINNHQIQNQNNKNIKLNQLLENNKKPENLDKNRNIQIQPENQEIIQNNNITKKQQNSTKNVDFQNKKNISQTQQQYFKNQNSNSQKAAYTENNFHSHNSPSHSSEKIQEQNFTNFQKNVTDKFGSSLNIYPVQDFMTHQAKNMITVKAKQMDNLDMPFLKDVQSEVKQNTLFNKNMILQSIYNTKGRRKNKRLLQNCTFYLDKGYKNPDFSDQIKIHRYSQSPNPQNKSSFQKITPKSQINPYQLQQQQFIQQNNSKQNIQQQNINKNIQNYAQNNEIIQPEDVNRKNHQTQIQQQQTPDNKSFYLSQEKEKIKKPFYFKNNEAFQDVEKSLEIQNINQNILKDLFTSNYNKFRSSSQKDQLGGERKISSAVKNTKRKIKNSRKEYFEIQHPFQSNLQKQEIGSINNNNPEQQEFFQKIQLDGEDRTGSDIKNAKMKIQIIEKDQNKFYFQNKNLKQEQQILDTYQYQNNNNIRNKSFINNNNSNDSQIISQQYQQDLSEKQLIEQNMTNNSFTKNQYNNNENIQLNVTFNINNNNNSGSIQNINNNNNSDLIISSLNSTINQFQKNKQQQQYKQNQKEKNSQELKKSQNPKKSIVVYNSSDRVIPNNKLLAQIEDNYQNNNNNNNEDFLSFKKYVTDREQLNSKQKQKLADESINVKNTLENLKINVINSSNYINNDINKIQQQQPRHLQENYPNLSFYSSITDYNTIQQQQNTDENLQNKNKIKDTFISNNDDNLKIDVINTKNNNIIDQEENCLQLNQEQLQQNLNLELLRKSQNSQLSDHNEINEQQLLIPVYHSPKKSPQKSPKKRNFY